MTAATHTPFAAEAGRRAPSSTPALEAEAGAKQEALERMEELRAAMMRTMEILHLVRAFFELKPDISRAEFGHFVNGALTRLPELQALEWIPRVTAADRDAFVAAARADGLAGFSLCEIDAAGRIGPAAEREEYWPVAYVEPAASNHPVMGLDLRADARRRAALERAAATGLPVATLPIRLAQPGPRRLGFLVVMAVREKDRAADSSPSGWVLAVFRVQRLVEQAFAPLLSRGVHVEIRDLEDESAPPHAVGESMPSGVEPAWSYRQDMPIAGRVWRFVFTPGPRFSLGDPGWIRRAAETLQRTNLVLEQRVNERTAELAARTAALEEANRELRAEAARREAAELALARADAQLSHLSEAEARQWTLAGLVGRSDRFGRLLRDVKAVQAAARTTVLLTGESGTGKELLARAIHYGGERAGGPFVRVDCSALPADAEQAEAVLFGASRSGGSRRGQCELAEGGTLFFDEIGDLPAALQARLLGVLEDGAYRPAGADQPRVMHARIVVATHADLPARVVDGRFRQDLYYRLGQYHIAVPALRERMEDVPALAQHFVKKIAADLKRGAPRLRPDALQRLLAHSYPGNIRELKNTLERAIIYAGGDELGGEHIAFAPQPNAAGSAPVSPAASGAASGAGDLGRRLLADLPLNLSEAEDVLIERALAVAEGNISKAARLLGINRASLYRWQERRAAPAAG